MRTHTRTYRKWCQASSSTIGPTCPICQTIHGSDAAVAIGRFNPNGARGFRSRIGGPLRPTRDEAIADTCERLLARGEIEVPPNA